jgi:trimeric autotransporter adhesin
MRTVGHIARRRLATLGAAASLLLVLAAPAAAATAPTAITGPVTAIAATTATLSGTVNPNGTATTWQFEYGPTTAYGTKTPVANAGAGTANTGVTANIGSLTAGTTYHYRIVATSTAGTTDGADGIFTTVTGPTVTTSAATGVSSSAATLNGSVNPNGRATTYFFDYGKDTSYGSKTAVVNAGSASSPVTVSAAISGLQAGQSYHFRLEATSDAGTSLGNDMSFTATASSGPAPGAPAVTTKAATNLTSTSATLNGSVNPNGLATTYYFEYGPSPSYGSKTTAASAGSGKSNSSVSATATGIGAGVYHFRLVASSSAGTTYGSDLTFGSAGPPVVLTGSAQGASTSGVTLTGSVNPQGNATTWWFEYGLTGSYGSKTSAKSAGSGSTATGVSAAITKLTAGTTYHYRLVAQSTAGTTHGSDVTFNTIAAISLQSSTTQVVYGAPATLSGTVATRQSGVTVSVLQEAYGQTSFSTLGSVVTGPGGTWSYQVRPKMQTSYQAKAPEGTSAAATVGVRPAVSLRVITGGRFTTKVKAATAFAGKVVQLQRLLPGNRWETLAKAKLSAKSSAIFSASKLPRGTSLVRVAMSVNQAGAGYLGGFSRTLSYHRA